MVKKVGTFLLLVICTVLFAACSTSVTVVFETNGGSEVETKVYENAESFEAPSAPVREHYEFKGWFTDEQLENEFKWEFPESTQTLTLYAKWELVDAVLHYDLDGGTATGLVNDQEVPYGTNIYSVLSSVVPTKTGYTFNGWLDANNVLLTSNSTVTMPDAPYTVKASWTINSYTVTLNPGEGTLADATVSVEYNANLYEAVSSKVPTLEHYQFDGWMNGETLLTATAVMPAENITLTAKWTANTNVLTFDPNGGAAGSVTSKNVVYDTNLFDVLLTAEGELPTREGYYFAGWYLSQTGADRVTETSGQKMPDQATTLYARWTRITYIVTYDVNGGSFTSDNVPAVIVYGENVKEFLANNSADLAITFGGGTQFIEWIYADGTKIGDNDVAHANISLKATWRYQVGVTFNGFDPVRVENAYMDEKVVDIIAKLGEDVPTLQYYIFKGWSFTEDGEIIDKDNIELVGTESLVLYPIFEKDEDAWINITFLTYKGMEVVEYPRSTPVTLPKFTPEEGITFDGWYSLLETYSSITVTPVTDALLEKGYLVNTVIVANCYTGALTDYTFKSNTLLMSYNGTETKVVLPSVNTTGATKYAVVKLGSGTTNPYSITVSGTANASAFKDKTTLESVTLPVLCAEAFNEAFSGCTSLKEVKFSEFSHVVFGPYAFKGCTSLESIDLANIVAISVGMFEGCTALKSVDLGERAAVIYEDAFKGCTALTSVSVPRSIKTLYSTAFEATTNYTIALNEDEKFVDGGIYSTDGKTLLNWVVFGGRLDSTVDSVDYATINIADGTEVIGEGAFAPFSIAKGGSGNVLQFGNAANCEIIFSSTVKVIEKSAFQNYVNYNTKSAISTNTKIVLNEGLETIKESAFATSNSILEINLPSTVKTIEDRAFHTLRQVKKFIKAENLLLETIGDDAFNSTSGIGDLVLDNLTSMGSDAFNSSGVTSFFAPKLEVLEAGSFGNASSLVSVKLPKVTEIPEDAFYNCSKLTMYGATENTIDLTGIVSVAGDGFNLGASPITSVVNIQSLKTVGVAGFVCKNVTTFGATNDVIDLSGLTLGEPTAQLLLFEAATKAKLAATQTTLPARMFYNWKALTTIGETDGVIDLSNVTEIETWAFYGCTKITTVKLNSEVSFSGGNTFSGCTLLDTLGSTLTTGVVDLTGISSLVTSMFSNCTAVSKVVLDSKTTDLPASVFSECKALTTVGILLLAADNSFTLPTTVKTLGASAFYNCKLSGDVVLHEGITTLGNNVFANTSSTATSCNKITSVVIPASATSLGTGMFGYNKSLTTVVINSSAQIKLNTFTNCTALASVTLNSTILVALANKSAFTSVPATCNVFVPATLVESYTTNSVWKTITCAANIQAIAA